MPVSSKVLGPNWLLPTIHLRLTPIPVISTGQIHTETCKPLPNKTGLFAFFACIINFHVNTSVEASLQDCAVSQKYLMNQTPASAGH